MNISLFSLLQVSGPRLRYEDVLLKLRLKFPITSFFARLSSSCIASCETVFTPSIASLFMNCSFSSD